jgi:hypothetical protein
MNAAHYLLSDGFLIFTQISNACRRQALAVVPLIIHLSQDLHGSGQNEIGRRSS